jgi:hypothetical protein
LNVARVGHTSPFNRFVFPVSFTQLMDAHLLRPIFERFGFLRPVVFIAASTCLEGDTWNFQAIKVVD